jgi:hypothetical protein
LAFERAGTKVALLVGPQVGMKAALTVGSRDAMSSVAWKVDLKADELAVCWAGGMAVVLAASKGR